jgi:Domain of unknown function (DUF222)
MNRELEQLGERIAEQAAHLDAATHRLLSDLREFDERGGWHAQGASSCAHWLAWRVGWDLVTARDHVRVARKLSGFPSIDDALRRGEVSYSKVRAMLRVATPANERLLLDHARLMTASQLENTCRGYALVQRHGQKGGSAVDELRRYVRRRDTEDGMVKIEAVLHPEEAELVWTMLTHAAAELADTAPAAATAVTPPDCDSAESLATTPSPDTDGHLGALSAAPGPSPDLAPSPSRDSAESPTPAPPSDIDGHLGALSAATSPSPDLAPFPSRDSAESPTAKPRVVEPGGVEAAAVPQLPHLQGTPDCALASRAASAGSDRAPSRRIRIWRRCDSTESWETLSKQASLEQARSEASTRQSNGDLDSAPHRSLLDRLLDEADELRGTAAHAATKPPPDEAVSSAMDNVAKAWALPVSRAGREASIVEKDEAGTHLLSTTGESEASRRQGSMVDESRASTLRVSTTAERQASTHEASSAGDWQASTHEASPAGDWRASTHEASSAGDRRASTRDQREAIEMRPATLARRGFNRADALVSLAQGYLRGDRPNRAPIEVMLTIPKACLRAVELGEEREASDPLEAGELGESFVSRETARRLSCDAGVVEVIEDEHGAPLSVGRKRRTIAGALKRALYKRDGACTFPGCTHRIFLEGHHIRHWADGGETSLNNALLLCSLHHRYVHEHGYTVELGADRRPRFRDAQGREVAAVPAPPPVASLGSPAIRAANAALSINATTIAGPWDGTPVDYARIVGHLAAVEHGHARPPQAAGAP